jgi:hypothetical protein
MKNKSGLSTSATVLIAFGIITIALLGYFAVNKFSTLSVIPATEYDGEFADVVLPEDAVGTDLEANVSYAEASDDTFNATFRTQTDLNGTDGETSYLAFQFELDGDVEALSIDGTLGAEASVTELVFKKAYILEDREGVIVDADTGVLYTATVNSDLDEFEFDLDSVADGKYVLVVEVKSLATITLASQDNLVDIEFDATTEGDVDAGTVYIINK